MQLSWSTIFTARRFCSFPSSVAAFLTPLSALVMKAVIALGPFMMSFSQSFWACNGGRRQWWLWEEQMTADSDGDSDSMLYDSGI